MGRTQLRTQRPHSHPHSQAKAFIKTQKWAKPMQNTMQNSAALKGRLGTKSCWNLKLYKHWPFSMCFFSVNWLIGENLSNFVLWFTSIWLHGGVLWLVIDPSRQKQNCICSLRFTAIWPSQSILQRLTESTCKVRWCRLHWKIQCKMAVSSF